MFGEVNTNIPYAVEFCHKIRIEGFIMIQFANQLPETLAGLVPWLMEGKIHLIKDIWEAEVKDVPKGEHSISLPAFHRSKNANWISC